MPVPANFGRERSGSAASPARSAHLAHCWCSGGHAIEGAGSSWMFEDFSGASCDRSLRPLAAARATRRLVALVHGLDAGVTAGLGFGADLAAGGRLIVIRPRRGTWLRLRLVQQEQQRDDETGDLAAAMPLARGGEQLVGRWVARRRARADSHLSHLVAGPPAMALRLLAKRLQCSPLDAANNAL